MKRKSDELKPILKRTLGEELVKLKRIKQQEYYETMLENQNKSFQFLSLEQREELAKCSSGLALNVVGSINCTLRKNKSTDQALTYLETIQKSNGELETSFYWRMVDRGIITDDQLSIKIIRILSNNPQTQKQGLLRFSALPEDLDEKPYKDDYLEFCAESTRKIMDEALKMSREKLEEESKERVAKKRTVSWVERTSSNQSSSPALPPN